LNEADALGKTVAAALIDKGALDVIKQAMLG
jgi:hypothetical protein